MAIELLLKKFGLILEQTARLLVMRPWEYVGNLETTVRVSF